MKNTRLIARLDIKNEYVIKGIHLEGLRKVGNPNEIASQYYSEGIDEILFMDAVASLYDRNNLYHFIQEASKNIFIPITLGGGIRSLSDIEKSLHSGADKVAINTQAVKDMDFIKEAVKQFGSQCIVASIEAKKSMDSWQAYIHNGRDPSGKDVLQWAKELEDAGAGEIIITSVDKEGTQRGFDIKLNKAIASEVSIPVIACGGCGKKEDINKLLDKTNVDAVAVAAILHYKKDSIQNIKEYLKNNGKQLR